MGMEGFTILPLEDVVDWADIFITTTGNKGILMADSMKRMKNNAIVGNIGHFDNEIDMDGLMAATDRMNIKPQVDKFTFKDTGRGVIVLAEGRLHLAHVGAKLTVLSKEQSDYIGIPVDGPYKP